MSGREYAHDDEQGNSKQSDEQRERGAEVMSARAVRIQTARVRSAFM
jgi:hypothetical protein